MNRRSFLKKAGLGGAVVAAVAPAIMPVEAPDSFSHRGWSVRWHGWRDAANQIVTIGFWSASRPNQEEMVVSCTTGTCDTYRDLYCIDTTSRKGVPVLGMRHTPEDRATAKRMALDRLLERL